jgi:hypothetical protein
MKPALSSSEYFPRGTMANVRSLAVMDERLPDLAAG